VNSYFSCGEKAWIRIWIQLDLFIMGSPGSGSWSVRYIVKVLDPDLYGSTTLVPLSLTAVLRSDVPRRGRPYNQRHPKGQNQRRSCETGLTSNVMLYITRLRISLFCDIFRDSTHACLTKHDWQTRVSCFSLARRCYLQGHSKWVSKKILKDRTDKPQERLCFILRPSEASYVTPSKKILKDRNEMPQEK